VQVGKGMRKAKATVCGQDWADACRNTDLKQRLCGTIASCIRAPGIRASKRVQPFTSLQLPMRAGPGASGRPVQTLHGALQAFAEPEVIDDFRHEGRTLRAYKDNKLGCLPEARASPASSRRMSLPSPPVCTG
jgi:hypothetical protein